MTALTKDLNYISTSTFPSTRYLGSKLKLVNWITKHLSDLDFNSCLDAFGGTGVVSYKLKQLGKKVTYNDYLKFNYWIARALIENNANILNNNEIEFILTKNSSIKYPTFIADNFEDIYFTQQENSWLDQSIYNISLLRDELKKCVAFFALCQACIIKRPYNLFHRKNLYLRLSDVKRTFGNKVSWDRPFEEWFRYFVLEANKAIFLGKEKCSATSLDVFDLPTNYDLVYIDPPYISSSGTAVDYRGFYHFLEGLANYEQWENLIDWKSKHRRILPMSNTWTNKKLILTAFEQLIKKFQDSILVISYRSDGIPTTDEILGLLTRYKNTVNVFAYGKYKYVLSTNKESKELLFIAK